MNLLLRRNVKRPVACLVAVLLLAIVLGPFFFAAPVKPQYCWLRFGQNADVSVLVCLKGKVLTLEHYADGKPTGRLNQFRTDAECKNIEIVDPYGTTSYVITRLHNHKVPSGTPAELIVHVEIKGPVSYRQYCDVMAMAVDPHEAPFSHFHGPLSVDLNRINFNIPPGLILERGDKPTDIRASVGTMDAQKGCWVVVNSQADDGQPTFPANVHPVVDVEFPSSDDAGGPIRRRYPLDKVC